MAFRPSGMIGGARGCCGTIDVDDKLVVTMFLDDVTTVATALVGTTASEHGTDDKDVSIIEAEGLIVAKADEVLDRSADALVLS